MMRYADGSVAQFDSGFAGPFRAEMEIVGAGGTLRIRRPFKTDEHSALEFTAADDTRDAAVRGPDRRSGEIADMEAAALDGHRRVSRSRSRGARCRRFSRSTTSARLGPSRHV